MSAEESEVERKEEGGGGGPNLPEPAPRNQAEGNKENDVPSKTESPGSDKKSDDSKHYSYEGDVCTYTDPSTKCEYVWDGKANSWKPKETQDYEYDGKTYIHTDEKGVKRKWNVEKNEWEDYTKDEQKEMEVGKEDEEEEEEEESEEDDNTTDEERAARRYRKRRAAPGWDQANYSKDPGTGATVYKDPKDGMVYEWDEAKRAWFPKVDEDFMAMYQLNYGFTKEGEAKPTVPDPVEEKPEAAAAAKPEQPQQKKKKEQEPAKWFEEDEAKSTKVYVAGLPADMTEEKFVEFMSKCGMVEHDIRSKKPKVKLYKDQEGKVKGDGLCSYIKSESVQLALTILDGAELDGKTVTVQRAKFEMKGESYDPKLKPRKLRKKELEKAKKQREKLFAWAPDKTRGQRSKFEKVIVIKNLFDPSEFDNDPGLIIDYRTRIRGHCSKFGDCTKIVLYDKHPEGICQVFFKEPAEADMAVQMMDQRLFGKKLMSVATWDGKTKYKLDESVDEEKERLQNWEKFLAEEEEADGKPADGGGKQTSENL